MNPVLGLFLRKELRDLRGNPQVWPGYLILPVIAVAIPVVMLALIPLDPGLAAVDPDVAAIFRLASRDPLLLEYPERERMIRLIIREVAAFFLLMPVLLAAMSAGLAIAAEKQQRTLEPILATPVSDRDLLLAKLIASVAPAVAVTWVAALLSVIAIAITTAIRIGSAVPPSLGFVMAVLVIAPLGGVVAALIAMRVSIRSPDIQSAVQAAGLWVIPAGIGLIALVGRPAIRSVPLGAVAAILLGGVVLWLFRGNLRRFQREEILTRWT